MNSAGVPSSTREDDAAPRAIPYAGVATRAVALAIDGALAQGVVFAIGAVVALVASLVGGNVEFGTFAKVLAAAAWILFVGGYFVVFWSTAGQTPGMRLMGVRVVESDGSHPGVVRSIVRVAGLALAIIPCFAGFLPVLVDNRRRGLQDFLARTVVIYDDGEPAVPLESAVAGAAERERSREPSRTGMTLHAKEQR